MTLHLHRGDGELAHLYWPDEARVRPEARDLYPTVGPDWVPVLLVVERGRLAWLPTTVGRPIPVPLSALETRDRPEGP